MDGHRMEIAAFDWGKQGGDLEYSISRRAP